MKLFFKRHCSSLSAFNLQNSKNPSPKESQIRLLCKFGALPDAFRVLNTIDSGQIAVKPILYASLLQACVKAFCFNPGLQIHAHVIKSGLETDRFVGNSLLALFLKLGSNFLETRRVFDNLIFKDVVSWTSMISGFVRAGRPRDGIVLFWDMYGLGFEPNGFTLSVLIKACSEIGDSKLGRCFHAMVVRRGLDSSNVIVSSLIDMYGRNCGLDDACRVFDEMPEPDAICWTSIISAMTRNDSFEKALTLFWLMQRKERLVPDGFTFGTVLTACGNLGRLKQGKEVHSKVITYGVSGNVFVESSLVDMYGKCGSVDEARRVFDRMTVKNPVSWSVLLGVYCHNGEFESVIRIFREMEKDDLYSFGTVLRACAGLAAVRQGKEIHCQYVRRGGWRDVIVESALVDLYAKCGSIEFAHSVFVQMPVRNLITWNSMICGFAQNGSGGDALNLFDEMIKEGIKPDYISFVGVLFACSHSGFVDQGRKYFNLMTAEYGIKAGFEHFNCMVDLLGRAGLLEEAENLIENADYRDDSSLWTVLLGACTSFTNSTAAAERIAKKMMKLKPDCHLSYILLANVYRAVGRWNDALDISQLMEDRGVKKLPGKSWIETSSKLDSHFDVGYLNFPGKANFPSVVDIR
ncbi:hypothetical protein UlMin_014366 [Ulmus minor]